MKSGALCIGEPEIWKVDLSSSVHSMRRVTAIALLILMTLAAASCGGGVAQSSSSPSPSPSPSPSAPLSATPSITSISPATAEAGSPDLTLTVDGANFENDSHYFPQLVWSVAGEGTRLATTVVNDTQVTAMIPASLLTAPVSASVSVQELDQDSIPQSTSNSVPFTVTAGSGMGVSPSSVTLGPRGSQQFVAMLHGEASEATWSIEEGAGGGSISTSGLYTVPDSAGTFHVVATFAADPSKSATATVTVATSGFISTGSMNKARSGHSATLLTDGNVLILDGEDGSAELFEPATGKFTRAGSMNTPRKGAAATLLANGKVLVVGGYGPGTKTLPVLNTAELYDSSTGTFTPTGNMVVPRVAPTATLLNDGRVLIVGGVGNDGPSPALDSAELYDPSTGTFTSTGGLSTGRTGHTATLLVSGKVLIAGGRNGYAPDSYDDPPWDTLFAEVFDPSTGTFTLTGPMSTTRLGHTATLLSDGKVLLLGGIPAIQNLHEQPSNPSYAEIFDPATSAFSRVAGLQFSEDSYTATLLKNGQVLIAGGEDAGVAVASAGLIGISGGTVTATGSLMTARKGHTATLLKDGRVLVTGGTDSNARVIATAEIYQ